MVFRTDTRYRTICDQRASPKSNSSVKSSPCRHERISSLVAEAEPPRQPSREGDSRSPEIESQTLPPEAAPRNRSGHADTNTFCSFSLPGVKISTLLFMCHQFQGAEDNVPLTADRHVYWTGRVTTPPPISSIGNNCH